MTPPPPAADDPGSRRRRRRGRDLVVAGGAVAAAWGAALAVNRSLRRVRGPSMLPTLAPGDLVLTLRRPTSDQWWHGSARSAVLPRRGDLVVARVGGVTAVKRVVGLPGDTVVLGDGHLHVDGSWWEVAGARPVDEDVRIDVGAGEVAVLGDNRTLSTDSRTVGPIPLDQVRRVVVCRLPGRSGPPSPDGPRRAWLPTPDVGTARMRRLDGPRRRDAVRVLVIGPDDRTLLFRVRDRDGGSARWWETPGGGLHPGETTMEAAERELAEEVGAPHGPIVDLGHVAERTSQWWGATIRRVEHHVATRVATTDVSTANWTAGEQADHVDWRWCTRAEVAALADPTFPVALDDLLDRALDVV